MSHLAFSKIHAGLTEALAIARAEPVPTYGLTREELIRALRVTAETVDGWLTGSKRRPPYFDAALRAARAGLHPIAKPLIRKYAKELGVPEAQMKYWLTTGQVPVPARMAVAWIIHTRVTGRT
jgi:hypothetical protein